MCWVSFSGINRTNFSAFRGFIGTNTFGALIGVDHEYCLSLANCLVRAFWLTGTTTDTIFCNARMNTKLIKKYCILNDEAKELLKMAMTELGLSARAYDKVLKVAITISDLAGSQAISAEHISEAIQYRSLDRQWW